MNRCRTTPEILNSFKINEYFSLNFKQIHNYFQKLLVVFEPENLNFIIIPKVNGFFNVTKWRIQYKILFHNFFSWIYKTNVTVPFAL